MKDTAQRSKILGDVTTALPNTRFQGSEILQLMVPRATELIAKMFNIPCVTVRRRSQYSTSQ